MTMTRSITAAVLVLAASACSSGRGETRHAAPPTRAQAGTTRSGAMAMPCPLEVPGTQVSASETPDGAAVTFTTTPDRAAELRSRVRAMADMHNGHHQGTGMGMGMGMGGAGGMSGSTGSSGTMMPPPSRATVEDVDGGARLVVTPTDRADLERLRSTVRAHAGHMQQTGQCGHAG